MKIISKIIQYILVLIIAITIIAIVAIKIATSTILSKEYTLKKLEETQYYSKIYQEVVENFEKYIYQSGLDEEVIRGIITEEKVEEDVKTIISNIYDGTDKKIDVTEINTNLTNKIEETISTKKLGTAQVEAIETFKNKISEEYIQTMTHTEYEQNINKIYIKVLKYVELAKKAILITILVSIVLILIICHKNIFKGIAEIGISITSSGIFYTIVQVFINKKINIETITILNGAISDLLRTILKNIVQTLLNYGIILLITGVILILIGNLVNSKKFNEEKN